MISKTPIKMKKYFLLLICTTFWLITQGQLTNAGKDFWFGYTSTYDNNNATYNVFVTSQYNTSGTISIPGAAFSSNFNITPGSVYQLALPANNAFIQSSEVIENKAVHVTANDDVVVYAGISFQNRSEASLVLPTQSLGDDYYVVTYPTNYRNSILWKSEFTVVCGPNPATVQITPSSNTQGGRTAGVPFTINLNPGQTYQVKANGNGDDLTGSRVRCTNNEVVSVYGGHEWAIVNCSPISNQTADPLFEVCYPSKSWGKQYILPVTELSVNEPYSVIAKENNTNLYLNGAYVTTINAGQVYYGSVSADALIEGDKPIGVGYYLPTDNCGGTPGIGDPSMILLNPIEQMTLDTITFFTISDYDIDTIFCEFITNVNDTNLIEYNGIPLTNFYIFPFDSNYAMKKFPIPADTAHTLTTSGCGFIAYVKGLGDAESYAYAAGVSLADLDNAFTFTDLNNGNVICSNSAILFNPLFTAPPINVLWDFGDGTFSNSDSAVIHTYADSGTYIVTLYTDYKCFSDTVTDTIVVQNSAILQLPEVNLCAYKQYELDAGYFAGYSYLWNTGATTQSIFVDSSGLYKITIDDGVCISSDSVYIDMPDPLFIPNVFSPNDDQLNDVFTIRGLNRCLEMTLSIYNRWGTLIYETKQPNIEYWNGFIKNEDKKVSPGTYYYIISSSDGSEKLNGKIQVFH